MKKVLPVMTCLAVVFALASCEEEWFKDDAKMGYVIEIADNGDGTCTYYFAASPDDKTREASMTSDCGLYQLRDGIFIPKHE